MFTGYKINGYRRGKTWIDLFVIFASTGTELFVIFASTEIELFVIFALVSTRGSRILKVCSARVLPFSAAKSPSVGATGAGSGVRFQIRKSKTSIPASRMFVEIWPMFFIA